MPLRRIQVTDFRCLRSVDMEFHPHLTLVSGPNASGKTSLLEAIYVLGRGRSFRTRKLDHLIRSSAQCFVVYGDMEAEGRRIGQGIEGSAQGVRSQVAGTRVSSFAHLAAALPVQIIDPEIHRLIEEGPSVRRRYLDWGVFHVEHAYLRQWQRFQAVLKQRNAALRAHASRGIVAAWDAELVSLGEYIDSVRRRYVEGLGPLAWQIARNLLGAELSIGYRSGWQRDRSFAESLAENSSHDLECGYTRAGPHRADLSLRLDGVPAKDRISRGQQKLLAASLVMAQLRLFAGASKEPPVLLLDDPAAELDGDNLIRFLGELSGQSLQLVVTSVSESFTAFVGEARRYALNEGLLLAR